MPLYGCLSVANASALLLCFHGLKAEHIISFFSSHSLADFSLSHTQLLCRSATYSFWDCRGWSSQAITKRWNFPGCWLSDACWVPFLIPAVCGFTGSGCLLAQVSLTILCIHFPWSGRKTEHKVKSCCLQITTDNIVVLTDICIRDMKTAPFIPFCDSTGSYNCFEIWGVLLLDCIRQPALPQLSAGCKCTGLTCPGSACQQWEDKGSIPATAAKLPASWGKL